MWNEDSAVYKLTVEGIKGYQSTVSQKFNIDYNEEYLLKNYKESDSKKFESLWYADSSLHNKGPVVYMVHYLWVQNFT